MPTIPSDAALAAAQPEWIIRQAASHYTASLDRHSKPVTRAKHRRKFVEYVADVLPVIGLDKALDWLRQILCGAHGKLAGDRHIVANKEPTANLLLAIANLYGAEVDQFGASTGRLDI